MSQGKNVFSLGDLDLVAETWQRISLSDWACVGPLIGESPRYNFIFNQLINCSFTKTPCSPSAAVFFLHFLPTFGFIFNQLFFSSCQGIICWKKQ